MDMSPGMWRFGDSDLRLGLLADGTRVIDCDGDLRGADGAPIREIVTSWSEGAISGDLRGSALVMICEWIILNSPREVPE